MKVVIPGLELRISRFDSIEDANKEIKKMDNPVVTKVKKENKLVHVTVEDNGKSSTYVLNNLTKLHGELDYLVYLYDKEQIIASGLSW